MFEYPNPVVLHTGSMAGKMRWHCWRAGGALGAALAIMASLARAADPPVEANNVIVARERPVTRSFYGWQILATGEAGGVVAAAATVLPDSPLKTLPSTVGFLLGMPFYVLGGPATHWTHGDFQKGLVSLGANFATPVIGGFVGQAIRCAPGDAPRDCGTTGFLSGFAVALVTVPLVDALVLGWEDIPEDDPVVSAGRKASAHFTMIPTWSLGPKGELGVGVAGRF